MCVCVSILGLYMGIWPKYNKPSEVWSLSLSLSPPPSYFVCLSSLLLDIYYFNSHTQFKSLLTSNVITETCNGSDRQTFKHFLSSLHLRALPLSVFFLLLFVLPCAPRPPLPSDPHLKMSLSPFLTYSSMRNLCNCYDLWLRRRRSFWVWAVFKNSQDWWNICAGPWLPGWFASRSTWQVQYPGCQRASGWGKWEGGGGRGNARRRGQEGRGGILLSNKKPDVWSPVVV